LKILILGGLELRRADILTSTATLLPKDYSMLSKIFTGVAAVVITLDRSLNWGGRWLYHRQMRHEYLNISARISLFENTTTEFSVKEKEKYFLCRTD